MPELRRRFLVVKDQPNRSAFEPVANARETDSRLSVPSKHVVRARIRCLVERE